MVKFISEIIEHCGPRPAGSDAEKKAQRFIEERCKEFTHYVRYIEFDEYLDARFGKLKYYVALYVASLLFYWFNIEMALVLSAVNVLFIVLDLMMYRDVLTKFPGKKQTSVNVEATLEPQGEVKQTIILSGHIDSTREYIWWYKLGEWGIKLTILAGVLIVLQLIFNLLVFVFNFNYSNYVWVLFAALSPVMIVYWNMHAEQAVPGAQDNLSGISIAYHVFKHFAHPTQKGKSTLQHTRLRFLSFGSEERGLCGSRHYAKTNKQQLIKENARLINIDGVRLVNEIAVVERELMNGTKHHPALIAGLKKSFESLSIPVKSATVPIGGTDAVSFARIGIPTVTIIGMSAKEYDFTYHTRHDVVENIEPESLEYVKSALIHYIKTET